ncbi:MAG: M48 family metallopeptidase [Oceanospirillaceae bacterium]|nr:M48 family metallopeptidase [Oceanospirillaceae bacterium]
MKQQLRGTYYFPASNRSQLAKLLVNGDSVNLYSEQQCIFATDTCQLSVASAIPGVAVEVTFADGGKFVAEDRSVRLSLGSVRAERLEKSNKLILASILLVPLLLWFGITVVMPKLAAASVDYLPDSVAQQMGEQTFYALKKTILEPSQLEKEVQLRVVQQWQQALEQLGLPKEKFQLHVFKSDYFGANALALPDGTVVITDELLRLLAEKPDAILAILLHEIGHVQRKHSIRMVAQSLSNTIAISVVFGDIEGLGEVIVGTGAALVQNAFSRNMEREADDFALQKLAELGKPATAFAEAMQSFLAIQERDNKDSDKQETSLIQYLTTHPDIKERIEKAIQYGK